MASQKSGVCSLTLHMSETAFVFMLAFRPPGLVGEVGKVSGAAHEFEQKR